MIDVRSDVSILPSNQMISEMMSAKVGHEGWNEDVNILDLELYFSYLCNKESAVFLPTMSVANTLAVLATCDRTDEVIAEYYSHLFQHSASIIPVIASVQIHPVVAENHSYLSLRDIIQHIRTNHSYPITRLIVEEVPHTIYGGSIPPIDELERIYTYAAANNIRVYLDGARLFHACVATHHSILEYSRYADALGVCLTKGLGCPYGALLCGSKEFISRVKYYKKMLGLNMHYVGYFAKVALFALKNNIDRINVDIENAKDFSIRLSRMKGIESVVTPEINIVQFNLSAMDTDYFITKLLHHGIQAMNYYGNSIRMVFSSSISKDDIECILKAVSTILEEN